MFKNKEDKEKGLFNFSFKQRSSFGFTLIELLVVVAIISMLFSAATASLLVAKRKANDSKRVSDIKNIRKAMEIYYNDFNSYPEENPEDGSWEKSYENEGDFINVLSNGQYVSGKTPTDPVNSSGKFYAYYKFPAGANGCDETKGAYYVLGIRDMETSGNPHPSSPGWSCPEHNWQNDFEWVIGGYEY